MSCPLSTPLRQNKHSSLHNETTHKCQINTSRWTKDSCQQISTKVVFSLPSVLHLIPCTSAKQFFSTTNLTKLGHNQKYVTKCPCRLVINQGNQESSHCVNQSQVIGLSHQMFTLIVCQTCVVRNVY